MADFDTSEFRAARFSRSAAEKIKNRSFPIVMRGYDRAAVDAFVQEVLEIVRKLEGTQSHESVVQQALEEVGEETASILQRAHETADEIAARSRAQAEGRLQRAEDPDQELPVTEEDPAPTEENGPPTNEVELDVLPGGAAEDGDTSNGRG